MKVLSLFDGMSCGQIAFKELGIEVEKYYAYEIDKYAIQVTQHNFPATEQGGDVFKADFTKYNDIDWLIGGSPCTYWSIAQKNNRETVASGMGWELFGQYVRALNEAKPKYFLYENNKSMSKDIRASIDKAFGFEAIGINSALVSAQNRQRLYWVGIRQDDGTYKKADIKQPDDRGILFKDIIETHSDWRQCGSWVNGCVFNNSNIKKIDILKTVDSDKSYCCTTKKGHPQNYICNREKTLYFNLNIIEYKKLQTIPEWYSVDFIPVAEIYKSIGNGWTVEVIKHLISSAINNGAVIGTKQFEQLSLF